MHCRFARAVAFLLQLDLPEIQQAPSLEDVNVFMTYTGPSVWLKTIKGFLKQPEPVGANYTELKHESREHLKHLYQDALRTAATEGPAMQLVASLQHKLENHSKSLEHHCIRPLTKIVEKIDSLDKQLREGGTDKLRALAVKFTRDTVDKALGLCGFHG